jgi:hypothetical protein
MLMLRALLAATTINSIVWYLYSNQIGFFNISIAAWCFMEWTAAFSECGKRDILDWVLPPLNQLCLVIRVFSTEINKMI